jgi:hypothetical protein
VPAFTGVQSTHWRSHLIACRAEKPGAGNDGISEDVLARLRAAEEEAAKLRQQLAIAQAAKVRERAKQWPGWKGRHAWQ